MHLLVSYDVVDNRRRTRLSKLLDSYLIRVQKSVFEGVIPTQVLSELLQKIEQEIDQDLDSVRIYRLCARCVLSVQVMGPGTWISEAQDEII